MSHQSDFFAKLGAPLAKSNWSSGSIRASDGTVFLRVWQDKVRLHEGSRFAQLTHDHSDEPEQWGPRERAEQVELIQKGARCYLVMCQAADVDAVPRKIKAFNTEEVFESGRVVEFDGDWWIEQGRRVPVKDVMPPKQPRSTG